MVLFIIILAGFIPQGAASLLFLILIVISLGYIIFVVPVYLARISDIYIDYSGYEVEDYNYDEDTLEDKDERRLKLDDKD